MIFTGGSASCVVMIKSELINRVGKHFNNLEPNVIAEAVNLILDSMSDSLEKGQRVEIRGFGSFSLHFRAPRNAHNPKTRERVMTAPKYSPHFKPGKEMRERINDSRAYHPINDTDEDVTD